MSEDVANLTLKVDTGQVTKATEALDDLAEGAKNAEGAVDDLGRGAKNLAPPLHDAQAEAYKLWRANNQVAASARDAGMSVRQYTAVMRGLPAQFTDIAVSLQGGMNPFTVMLQQGGQIRDMFGSIPAALAGVRTSLGSLLGAVNPLTLGVAGLGAALFVGYKAYKSNADAAEELEKAHKKLKSGVDVTAESLKELAEKSGQSLSEMASQLNRVSGDPVKGLRELSDATGDVTAQTYAAATALQESGDKAGAMKLYVEELGRAKTDYKQIADAFGTNEVSWWRQIANETQNAISKVREYMVEKNKVKADDKLKAKIKNASTFDLSWMEFSDQGFQTDKQREQQQKQAAANKAIQKMTLDTLAESQKATQEMNRQAVESLDRVNKGFMSNISAVDRYKEKLKEAKKDRDALAKAGMDTTKADQAILGLQEKLATAEKTAAGRAKAHHATKVKLTEAEKERLRVERAIQRAEEQSAAAAKRRQAEVDRALAKSKEARESMLRDIGLSSRDKKLNQDIAGIRGDNRYTDDQKNALVQSRKDDLEAQKVAMGDLLGGMSTGFKDTIDQMSDFASQGANLAATVMTGINDQFVQLFTTGKASVKDFAVTILSEFTKIATNKAITGLLSSFGGGGGGGGFGGLFSSFTSFFANADGGAYGGGNLSAFSGQVVSQPTAFTFGNKFANGAGLMGEAGPEAIMPLQRGPNGKLGVAAVGGGGSGSIMVNTEVNIQSDGTASATTIGDSETGRQLGDMINAGALKVIKQQLKSGGLLAKK
ncbi:tail tape measure protein [Serratia phage vB_SmaM-ChibiTotoro]|nr:tail tape measure protein [Serratia phage vB_SmaM-ChibiTotoro]